MKTEVEKGLASHSSNMVAPHDYHREPEDGWTVVMSKKNLRKTRKNKKNDFKKVFDASSVVDSVKSTTSADSSWASIVKRSLKTKVPKVNFDFMDKSSNSSTSRPEQKIESKKVNNPPEEVVIQPKEISPPQIINISDDEDLSSIESLFMTSKDEPNQDPPVPNSIEHKNEITQRTGHFKKHPEREINIEKRKNMS